MIFDLPAKKDHTLNKTPESKCITMPATLVQGVKLQLYHIQPGRAAMYQPNNPGKTSFTGTRRTHNPST